MASSASEAPRREGEEHQDAPSNLRESNDLTRNEIQTNPSTTLPHATPPEAAHSQAVRFSSVNQEIEPEHSLQSIITSTSRSHGEISPEQETDLRNLSKTLQNTHLQRGRMSNFAFEPVSLPASRVPTNETLSRHASREYNKAADSLTAMDTPPLTPAASQTRAGQQAASRTDNAIPRRILPPSMQMTKAHSPQKTPPLTAVDATVAPSTSSSAANSRPASSSGRISTQSTSESQRSETVAKAPKQAPQFVAGPTGDSIPPSREGSPPPGSGAVTPPAAFTRPFTPLGDKDDPYARSKRLPQPRNLDTIDPRFKFEGKDARRRSYIGLGSASSSTVPRSPSVGDLKASEKRASGIFGGKNDHLAHLSDEGKHHGGSMSDLKRFFKIGHHHRREKSSSSARGSVDKSGTRTPPHQLPPSNIPFADDHGLQTKYGTFGKILGSGAGGSVRVMKRSSDGVTFAVKQFRERHSFENAREYAKKVTAEFCIGSTLHHGNIIETLDIVLEKGRWYEVMEYAPYDLFAIVMTGKMSREEIACSFLQIFSGVTYLHSMGLAHRDLKLDNVVVNEHGIMKLIDFGSASVFRYPFENDIVLATGIVGSDPYLAPEVYDQAKYDPQPTDIWSLAIIFVCMSLRRFPWKLPKTTDASFKMFVASPTPSTTPTETVRRRSSHERPKSMFEMTAAEGDSSQKPVPQTEPVAPTVSGESKDGKHRRHHHHSQQTDPSMLSGPSTLSPSHLKEPIKGPWRLLRLLPRESRPIMSQMLEVDPKKRATLEMMLNDPWISATPVCSQVEGGRVIRAAGHQHTLEPGTGSPPPKK